MFIVHISLTLFALKCFLVLAFQSSIRAQIMVCIPVRPNTYMPGVISSPGQERVFLL